MGNSEKRRARAKIKKKHLARMRASGNSGQNIKMPNRIVVNYGSTDALAVVGPMIKAMWSVPPSLASRLQSVGRNIPPPVSGFMLVDTGASRTCMALDVAEELGINPVGIQRGYGVGGEHTNKVFPAFLTLAIMDNLGQQTTIQIAQHVAGIPDLEKCFDKIELEGKKPRMIGLLGRDFLRHVKMNYDGPNGSIDLRVELSTLRQAPPIQSVIK